MTLGFWRTYGGLAYAARPDLATKAAADRGRRPRLQEPGAEPLADLREVGMTDAVSELAQLVGRCTAHYRVHEEVVRVARTPAVIVIDVDDHDLVTLSAGSSSTCTPSRSASPRRRPTGTASSRR